MLPPCLPLQPNEKSSCSHIFLGVMTYICHPILPTHTRTYKITTAPQLWPLNYAIFVFTSSNSPQDHSDLMAHPSFHRGVTNSTSHWNADISCGKTAPSSQYMASLHNTQGWKETTTRSHWNCRGTTHNNIPSTAKIWPGHGANIHTFAKGAIRSVLASSTQCLETWHHTLSPKYTVT